MFKKIAFIITLLCGMLNLAIAGTNFVEGQDYVVLENASAPHPVDVMEFFNYGCPWCARLEPNLQAWLKSQPSLRFERIPVVFHKDWLLYAKTYYLLDTLGKNATLDNTLFETVQKQKNTIDSIDKMERFLEQHGIAIDLAKSALNHSTTIELKLTEGREAMQHYQIAAVPAFVVRGIYKTDLQMAKNEKRLIEILNFLLKKPKP